MLCQMPEEAVRTFVRFHVLLAFAYSITGMAGFLLAFETALATVRTVIHSIVYTLPHTENRCLVSLLACHPEDTRHPLA